MRFYVSASLILYNVSWNPIIETCRTTQCSDATNWITKSLCSSEVSCFEWQMLFFEERKKSAWFSKPLKKQVHCTYICIYILNMTNLQNFNWNITHFPVILSLFAFVWTRRSRDFLRSFFNRDISWDPWNRHWRSSMVDTGILSTNMKYYIDS